MYIRTYILSHQSCVLPCVTRRPFIIATASAVTVRWAGHSLNNWVHQTIRCMKAHVFIHHAHKEKQQYTRWVVEVVLSMPLNLAKVFEKRLP